MSNDKLKIKEIKSTSELGCMLDTERTWIELPPQPKLPNSADDVEVKLKDGTITIGWFYELWYVQKKYGEPNQKTSFWSFQHPNNPVVAWRELVTDNK